MPSTNLTDPRNLGFSNQEVQDAGERGIDCASKAKASSSCNPTRKSF